MMSCCGQIFPNDLRKHAYNAGAAAARVLLSVAQPPKRPGSPMSGEPLRPKDLIPVIFTLDSEKEKVCVCL